jgi:hypothetical protein
MVWRRMGLLDDAIREHLELKRRRGADPEEVAREQREALESGDVGPLPAAELSLDPSAATEDAPSSEVPSARSAEERSEGASPLGAKAPEPAETAELDMETVLDDPPPQDLGASPVESRSSDVTERGAAHGNSPEDGDSLEWEMPHRGRDDLAKGRDSEGAAHAQGTPEEPDEPEDVLEETPDFLRDAPDQERLWFEQRPPRDFDFDS